MTPMHKASNLVGVLAPPVGVLVAIVLLWNTGVVGWTDLALLAGMFLLSGIGITIGFHRLLTHRAFETSRPVRDVLAVLGSMAVQGPVISWVADHRKHHAFTDEEGDPHSPHLHGGTGVRGAVKGLWSAHVGWLFTEQGRAERERYAPDLCADRDLAFIDRKFLWWVLLGLAIPFAVGFAAGGTLAAGLTGVLWGGFVRIFLGHHVTWSINSVCHFFGSRRFDTDDESRNVFWLAPISLGEAWHHNHHAFPRSAFHGLRRREIDPAGTLIRVAERLGLVWNVVRVTPEQQARKAAGATAAAAAAPAEAEAEALSRAA
jgi:stearoyl-CoA desaturase (Delta-9 desaturase)